MDTLRTVGERLAGLEVVTAGQWAAAVGRAGPRADVAAVVAALRGEPAWWAPAEPALSDYQAKHVVALAAAGLADRLATRLRVRQYLVLGELGRGGMGTVLKAYDLGRRRLVALKRVRNPSPEARRRFRREADLQARLDHPNVAKFVAVETAGGSDLLVMEYLAGATVSRWVRTRAKLGERVEWPLAVRWADQVLDALEHLHRRHVIHRDIKPGNVMVVGPSAKAKLLDLGLATCTTPGAEEQLTRAGQVLGTQEYMPPEQWAGRDRVVPGSDLYGLGGTLFFALAGRPPFPGESVYELCRAHTSGPVPSVRTVRPDVPAAVDAVIQRMLAKDPAHRGTARELKWQFRQLLALRPAGEPPPVVERPKPAPRPVAEVSSGAESSARTGSLLRELAAELTRVAKGSVGRGGSAFGAGDGARLRYLWGEVQGTAVGRRLAWWGAGATLAAGVGLVAWLG